MSSPRRAESIPTAVDGLLSPTVPAELGTQAQLPARIADLVMLLADSRDQLEQIRSDSTRSHERAELAEIESGRWRARAEEWERALRHAQEALHHGAVADGGGGARLRWARERGSMTLKALGRLRPRRPR
jgi:hypothetical protein